MNKDMGVAASPPLCGPTGGASDESPAKPAAANAWRELNLNHRVRIRLTPEGIDHLRRNHDSLNEFAKGLLGDFIPPKQDAEGWSEWQLWAVMHELGGAITMGSKVPFETTIQVPA